MVMSRCPPFPWSRRRPRLPAPLGTERRDDGAGSGGHCSIARVRRLVGWIGGALGGVTAYRLLRRRPEVASEPADDPAAELRAKLAETRAAEPAVESAVEEQVPAEPAEPIVEDEQVEPESESPEDRRRRVYEEGRAALDAMVREPEADADS